jgi:hypothetical protein
MIYGCALMSPRPSTLRPLMSALGQKRTSLLDNLVSNLLDLGRHLKSERFGSLEIDQ